MKSNIHENIITISIMHLIKCVQAFGIKGVGFNYKFFKYKMNGVKNRKKKIKCLHLKRFGNHPVYYRTNSSDIPLVHSILVWNGEYDVEVDEEQFDAILDLGANIGLFSLNYCLRFPGKKFVAVEPEENNYTMAIKNLNSFEQLSILKAGVWWREAKLNIESHGTDWSFTVKEVDEGHSDYDIIGLDIDTICTQHGIDNDKLLVKMDIEGTEKEIFEHIDDAKWIDRTNYLIMEIHDDEQSNLYKKICEIMTEKGFVYSSRGENTFFLRRK